MFETSAVETRLRTRSRASALMLPVSVGIHALAVSGALFFSVWNIELPDNAPKQMRAFTVSSDIPVPPGGGETPRARPEPVQRTAVAARPQEITAPTEVSETRADIAAESTSSSVVVGEGVTDVGSGAVGTGTGDGTGTGEGEGVGDGVGDGTGDGTGAAPTGPLVPGGNVKSPVIVVRPDPKYPDSLRSMRMKGFAVVECIIGVDGLPRAIELKVTNHALFGAAAVEAVSKWRFRPGTLNGRAVETILQLKVDFTLR